MEILLENNVIHRDIKLQNILIKNNKAVISDFGLSHKLPKNQSELYLDRISGSEGYLAPEILKFMKTKSLPEI